MTDTPQVLLAHHLKTLKLPTFLLPVLGANTTSWPANAPPRAPTMCGILSV